jgi:hypothetical protein
MCDDVDDVPDPEDTPTFEGQVVFKGNFESYDVETVHENHDQ